MSGRRRGRLVTDRVAQGDDLGRFSSKYSVYISRERERATREKREEIISCLSLSLPPNPHFQQKSILVD